MAGIPWDKRNEQMTVLPRLSTRRVRTSRRGHEHHLLDEDGFSIFQFRPDQGLAACS